MQVVVKRPHIKMEGEISSELITFLKERYGEFDIIENEEDEIVEIPRFMIICLCSYGSTMGLVISNMSSSACAKKKIRKPCCAGSPYRPVSWPDVE